MTNPLSTPRIAHVCKPVYNHALMAALCATALQGSLLLMPGAAQALELDYQHQYNEKDRDHTDARLRDHVRGSTHNRCNIWLQRISLQQSDHQRPLC